MGARPSFPIVQIPRDRIAVVTGGNTGLGYEIAKWLAMMGATVIIGCRSEQRAAEAIERMNKEYQQMKEEFGDKHQLQTYDSLAVSFMSLDLGSFKSTLQFVDEFKKSGRNLHILVCNAGIGMAPYEKTIDGFEKMLQVNYLSHFLMVAKLLPVMRKSGPDCRILFMSSDAHRACSFDVETMNYEGNASKFGRLDYYGRSKLYQIMQMYSLARRFKGTNVSINSSHPGIVDTEINRNFQDSFFWSVIFFKGSKLLGKLKSPIDGASSIINAAVNPELAGVSGRYYYNCTDGNHTSISKTEQNRREQNRTKQMFSSVVIYVIMPGDIFRLTHYVGRYRKLPNSYFEHLRDVNKQEALWKQTMEYLKDYITDEERDVLENKSS